MNYSTAVMLINSNIRAIRCSYEPSAKAELKPSTYIFKTLDRFTKPGDYVVVPTDTRWKRTVVKVEEVDVDIDFDDTTAIKWVIGGVSVEPYEQILAEEEKWIDALKAAEKRKKRGEIRKSMEAMVDDAKVLEALPISSMGGAAAIEQK